MTSRCFTFSKVTAQWSVSIRFVQILRTILFEMQFRFEESPDILPHVQSAFNNTPSQQLGNVARFDAFDTQKRTPPVKKFLGPKECPFNAYKIDKLKERSVTTTVGSLWNIMTPFLFKRQFWTTNGMLVPLHYVVRCRTFQKENLSWLSEEIGLHARSFRYGCEHSTRCTTACGLGLSSSWYTKRRAPRCPLLPIQSLLEQGFQQKSHNVQCSVF